MPLPETPPPADDSRNPASKVSDRAALEAALAGAAGLLAGRLLLGKGAGLAAGGAVIAARLIMDWQKSKRASRETSPTGDQEAAKETDKMQTPPAVPVPAEQSSTRETAAPEVPAITTESGVTEKPVESAHSGDSYVPVPGEADFRDTEPSEDEPFVLLEDSSSGTKGDNDKEKEMEREMDTAEMEPAPPSPAPWIDGIIPEAPQDKPSPLFEENTAGENPVFADIFQETAGPPGEWKPEPESALPAATPDGYTASTPLPPFPVTSLELESEPEPETLLSAPPRPADSFSGIAEFPLLPNPESFNGEEATADEKPARPPEPVITGFPVLSEDSESAAPEATSAPAPVTPSASPAPSLPAFPEVASPAECTETGDSITPLSESVKTEPQDPPASEIHASPDAGTVAGIMSFPETSPAVDKVPDSAAPASASSSSSAPAPEEKGPGENTPTGLSIGKPEGGDKDEENSAPAEENFLTESSEPGPSEPTADSLPEPSNAPASASGFDTPDPLSVFEDELPEPAPASISGPLLSSTPLPSPISITAAPSPVSENTEAEGAAPETPDTAPASPSPLPAPETRTRFIRREDVEEFQAKTEFSPAAQGQSEADEDQPPPQPLALPAESVTPGRSSIPAPTPETFPSSATPITAVTGILSHPPQPAADEPAIGFARPSVIANAPAIAPHPFPCRPRPEKPGPLPGPSGSHTPLRPLSLPRQPAEGNPLAAASASASAPTSSASVKTPVQPAPAPQAAGPGPGMAVREPQQNPSLPAQEEKEKETFIASCITTLCSTPAGRFTIILIVAAVAALAVLVVKQIQKSTTPARAGMGYADSLSVRVAASRISRAGIWGWASRSSMACMAVTPISRQGWRTVVSGTGSSSA
ncbi:MAG: hypothetical protein JWM59_5039 [Verrucomicrobiales bacterium]|nr:hypothetical protein [Verrucomicrobiales bacterium]